MKPVSCCDFIVIIVGEKYDPLQTYLALLLCQTTRIVYIVLSTYNFVQAMKTCLDELMPVTVNGGSTFKKSLTD
jgi:hypothetical protein